MRLPNAYLAMVEREKITEYLLSSNSTDSQHKADFFSRFGFNSGHWHDFARALVNQGAEHEVVRLVETVYGLRYHVDGIIETPDGRNPRVRTVWQVDVRSDFPRLITAYPSRS